MKEVKIIQYGVGAIGSLTVKTALKRKGLRLVGTIDQRNNPQIEKRNERFAARALLPRERPAREFLWQRSSLVLHHGENMVNGVEIAYEYPGYDLFLPYWMGRQAGVIPAPKAAGNSENRRAMPPGN